ncbi:hypothetical protein WMY93_004171 [Mugilogobius chulae]|uniref:Uncharacterized protein n=1 Tax=Mugilogobius chulae TaxID=88201 RepID=A0AAW0Q2S1_9GOBI
MRDISTHSAHRPTHTTTAATKTDQTHHSTPHPQTLATKSQPPFHNNTLKTYYKLTHASLRAQTTTPNSINYRHTTLPPKPTSNIALTWNNTPYPYAQTPTSASQLQPVAPVYPPQTGSYMGSSDVTSFLMTEARQHNTEIDWLFQKSEIKWIYWPRSKTGPHKAGVTNPLIAIYW